MPAPPTDEDGAHRVAAESFSSGVLVIEATAATPLGPKVVYANDDACRLSGYDRESLIGSPLGLVYDRKDLPVLMRKLPIVAGSAEYCYMERDLVHRSNLRQKMRWTIRPTRRAGEQPIPGLFTLTFAPSPESVSPDEILDVPPIRRPHVSAPRAVEVEETSPQEIETVDEEVSELERLSPRERSVSIRAGGVAHDFKNALQQMMSNLELAEKLADSAGGIGPKLRELLGGAMEALTDAEALALQMLAFSRGDFGARRLFDVGELVLRASRFASAGSNIRIRERIHPSVAPVEGDPDQIYQVLNNLLINATQAMPNGGVIDLSATTRIFADRNNDFALEPGRYTVISVRDRGIGIEKENLARIFSGDFSTKENGCGFGLASCKSIVEEHGGSILVASRPGVGSQFLVVLPASDKVLEEPQDGSADSELAEMNPRANRPAVGPARILVVEDEPGVCKSTCLVLKHFGHETCTAESGEEGLAVFRRHLDSYEPIDLVIVDMTLPGGLDGEAVCREIRKLDDSVPVIATSGYFDAPGQSAIVPGFDGAIAKPFTMDALELVISGALSS